MPAWCYHRTAAPLAQAVANLALYDLVGSRDELPSFLAAASAALGWPTNVGRVPLLEETKIRRGVSDGDALAVHQANQADTQLFMGMCAPAGARACDAIRGARSAARTAAWSALARERPYDKVRFCPTLTLTLPLTLILALSLPVPVPLPLPLPLSLPLTLTHGRTTRWSSGARRAR